jgi:CheY-like chemotaxis protein
LVIDDAPTVRDLLARPLTREGWQMVTAVNGEEGLQLPRTPHPVAITFAILLPEMDSGAVLAALHADPLLASIPTIMLSISDDKHTGFALGATAFLTKPINAERLRTVPQRYSHSKASNCIWPVPTLRIDNLAYWDRL